MSYQSYPELKDSGVEWLGEIPAHWDAKRLKFCVELINDKSDSLPHEMKYVGLENIESKTGRLLLNGESEGAEGACNLFKMGDVLFGKLRPYLAKALLAEFDGACTTELLVMRPQLVTAKYLLSYILSENFINTVDGSTYGAKMPRASWDFIGNLPQLIPPLEEQQAIAAFLDRKTAELDELIRLKEQQIELLGAKRQALISHAVTRGLDPSVKMRPSGVEWLGEIPAHWELLRLKFCLCSIEQGWSPSCENRMAEPDEWGVLKVGCVNGTSFDQSENKALPSSLEPLLEYEIKDGDVLMSRANTRELLGSASVVENVRPRLLLCDKLYRLNLKAEVLNNYFLVFALGASVARHQIERDATGASDSMQNIGQDTVRNLWLPIPPIEEQLVIVDHIRLETSQIDIVVKTIRSQIDRLREYRQALISAAVTGKIDVRGVSV